MIDQDSFIREVDKTCRMMRQAIARDVLIWIYEKLGPVNEYDFYKAMDDFLREGERPTFNTIERHISRRRMLRLEREAKEQSAREASEIKSLLNGEEPVCNREQKCQGCAKFDTCRIYGKAAIKNMIAVATGQKTVRDAINEMDVRFPGRYAGTTVAGKDFF